MIPKKSAGDIIETQCTRCRKLMNHTIVAMVGEKVVRVECNTCHGTHNYRAPKPEKAAAVPKTPREKAATTRKEKKDPTAADCAEWANLQPSMDPEQAKPYDMAGKYRVKSLISHPLFGLGIVLLSLPPNKIEVLFKDGKKRLRCG